MNIIKSKISPSLKDELQKEIKTAFRQEFPDLPIDNNNETYEIFESTLFSFLLPLYEDEILIYFRNREETKELSLHIADIPKGISHFEEWLNNGLLGFANSILNTLKQTIPDDKVYLVFAHFLDNKDFDLFIQKSNFSEAEKNNLNTIFPSLMSSGELDTLMQAVSCIYVGLENSANSLLKVWIQSLWFDGHDIQKTIDEAKKIVAIRQHYSKAGTKGSKKRWTPKEETRTYAIELMQKDDYKNPNQAADKITPEVIRFGKTVGWSFTTDFQAQKTIYNWLLKHNNTNK